VTRFDSADDSLKSWSLAVAMLRARWRILRALMARADSATDAEHAAKVSDE
jgi:hypothetical protein